MGWASGADLADSIWDEVAEFIPKDKQAKVAASIIDIFEGRDCDTMMETALWELANEHCSECKFEEDLVDGCKNCEGWGWVRKDQ